MVKKRRATGNGGKHKAKAKPGKKAVQKRAASAGVRRTKTKDEEE